MLVFCDVIQVQAGYTDFVPDPLECRAMIAANYRCPSTLLVRFANDNIDQTQELEGLLAERVVQLQEQQDEQQARQQQQQQRFNEEGEQGSNNGASDASTSSNGWGSPISLQAGVTRVTSSHPSDNATTAAAGWSRSSAPNRGVDRYQLDTLVLPGTHLTPCGGDITWDVGPVYTPVDAVLQAAKAGSQAELRQLGARLIAWLDGNTSTKRGKGDGRTAAAARAVSGSKV